MANKYPYVASAGPLLRTVEQLRKSFPRELTAETLRKLGIAPKNESYVINVLRFLGVVDDEGKKVDVKAEAFDQHKDEAFAGEFEKLVKEAYEELFELHGDAAWTLDKAALTQFFRTSDHSTEVVGTRQAGTFSYLAGLAGRTELPAVTRETAVPRKAAARPSREAGSRGGEDRRPPTRPVGWERGDSRRDIGLTVRIEVNLPADGDQDTYDRIFRSIRKNLIDGE